MILSAPWHLKKIEWLLLDKLTNISTRMRTN